MALHNRGRADAPRIDATVSPHRSHVTPGVNAVWSMGYFFGASMAYQDTESHSIAKQFPRACLLTNKKHVQPKGLVREARSNQGSAKFGQSSFVVSPTPYTSSAPRPYISLHFTAVRHKISPANSARSDSAAARSANLQHSPRRGNILMLKPLRMYVVPRIKYPNPHGGKHRCQNNSHNQLPCVEVVI